MNKFLLKYMAIMLSLVMSMGSFTAMASDNTSESAPSTSDIKGFDTAYNKTLQNIQSIDLQYGNEWEVIGLARAGYKIDSSYFASVEDAYNGGRMKTVNDFSKAILAFTAAGRKVPDEFFEKLSSYKAVSGYITTAVWALIALDSNGYSIPQNSDTQDQNTRDKMIEHILSEQMDNGMYGYTLRGVYYNDVDTTAMVLQALARYTDRSDVAGAVYNALSALESEAVSTCESYAQIISAYDALDITDGLDEAVLGLLDYYTDEGFKRYDGKVNAMSTQQAFYAMNAYLRQKGGENSLYDMSDAFYSISHTDGEYIVYTPYINSDALLIKIFNDSDGYVKSVDTSGTLKRGTNTINADKVMLWDSFKSMKPVCKISGE